ncbi:hypothetical protein HDU97_006984, partial [Phlyctochytrium planicorne]
MREITSLNGRQFRKIVSNEDVLAFVKTIVQCYPSLGYYLPGNDKDVYISTRKRIDESPERITYWAIFEDAEEAKDVAETKPLTVGD